MKDYEVRRIQDHTLETTIFNCSNVIEARNKFARKKGYKDWGNMTVKFREARNNDLQKPPYYFTNK